MDEALRRAERSADWEERARALRRAGQEALARCWVSAAARAGLSRAGEVLSQEYPLDRDAEALLSLLQETPTDAWGVEAPWAAEILLGDGDPRLSAPAAAWFEERAAASAGGFLMVRSEVRERLVASDFLARIALMVQEGSLGLDRSLLLAHELEELVDRLLARPLSVAGRLRLAALLRRSKDPGLEPALEPALRRVLRGPDPAENAQIAALERGRAGGSLEGSLESRPGWAPGVHRDGLTLSLTRAALRPWGRSPVGFELPDVDWVGLFDLDHTQSINDRYGHEIGDRALVRVTEVLQGLVGDRVVRFAGDEWLIPWGGKEGPERFQACVGAVKEDRALQDLCGGVTISAGATRRTGASARDLQQADQAQFSAKQAGRGRVVVSGAS